VIILCPYEIQAQGWDQQDEGDPGVFGVEAEALELGDEGAPVEGDEEARRERDGDGFEEEGAGRGDLLKRQPSQSRRRR